MPEVLQSNESIVATIGKVHFSGDVLNIFEGEIGTGLVEVINELMQIHETISRLAARTRVRSEAMEGHETTARALGFVRVLSEAVLVARNRILLMWLPARLWQEQIIEAVVVRTQVQILGEVLEEHEASQVAVGLSRVINEVLEIHEVIVDTLGVVGEFIVKVISELLEGHEAVLRSKAMRRVDSVVMELHEAVTRSRILVRVLSHPVDLVEITQGTRAIFKVILDGAVSMVSTIARARGRIKPIPEDVVVIEELPVIALGFSRVVSEVLEMHETTARFLTQIGDVLTEIAPTEVVRIIEFIDLSRGLVRIVNEVMEEAEATLHAFVAFVVGEILRLLGIRLGLPDEEGPGRSYLSDIHLE